MKTEYKSIRDVEEKLALDVATLLLSTMGYTSEMIIRLWEDDAETRATFIEFAKLEMKMIRDALKDLP